MALKLFNAPVLPKPPATYQESYTQQLVRNISIYFSQLDSMTPNQAESYTASYFYGAPVVTNATTVARNALAATAGLLIFDTTLQKMCFYTGDHWEILTSVDERSTYPFAQRNWPNPQRLPSAQQPQYAR